MTLLQLLDIINIVCWVFLAVFLITTVVPSTIFKMTPPYPSQHVMRQALIDAIKKYYPNAKTLIDIGSGWGGLARMVGKQNPNMRIVGLEYLPLPWACSKIVRFFMGPRNVRFIYANAFKYIPKHPSDIGVSYLLKKSMPRVNEMSKYFRVLIVLDFPIPDREPTHVIDLHHDELGKHRIFVYEN